MLTAAHPPVERAAVSHLADILAGVSRLVGPLKAETMSAVVGFDAGGPVSIVEAARGGVYVTTELHDIIDQVPSDEGVHYELGLVTDKGPEFAQKALTLLGRYFLDTSIRDGVRIEVHHDDLSPHDIVGTAHMIGSDRGDCGCYLIVPDGHSIPGAMT